LTSPKGVLTVFASKTSDYTASLLYHQQALAEGMNAVKADVESHTNINIEDIGEALCSLVQAREDPLELLKTVVTFGYSAATTITTDEGDKVNKKMVIKKVRACGASIKSLHEAFKMDEDGTLSTDDPDATKVLATKESIDEILESYQSAIPESRRADLSSKMNKMVNCSLARNDAIITYNNALQRYSQAVVDKDNAKSQQQTWGNQQMTLNPALPAVYFWLRKLRSSMYLDVMQYLWYGARAISFWAAKDITSIAGTQPSPVRGYTDLETIQNTVNSQFATCLHEWAGRTWSVWPYDENTQTGLLYKLTDAELAQFLSQPTSVTGPKVFTTTLTFHPDSEFWAGRYYVRLNQARIWLVGAKAAPDHQQRQLVNFGLSHGGTETIRRSTTEQVTFLHDRVSLNFTYDAARIRGKDDIGKPGIAFSKQALEQDYRGGMDPQKDVKAAIGPLTTWTIELKEAENPGLDVSQVTEAYLEFWGRSTGGDQHPPK
jgi:hypothetical protein